MSLVGSRLGHYQLLRQIGSGGMGTIYLAQDTHMPRQVAVKVVRTDDELPANSDASQRMEKLFYREMQAIAQLDHSHILPVYDFGKENIDEALYTYLVMPYRPEGSLADWLRQARNNDFLPPSEVAKFLLQAAEALQHAHDHGVIHQDVKPPNFLLRTRSSQPGDLPDLLLADFGIARFFASTSSQSMSQSHNVRGTPMFMAPEQWEGKTVPASDQYALAIMAFRLLTGQLPFQGSLGQIMHHHYMMQPPDPSSLNSQLGSSIDAVIKRALAKQSSDRFPSILEFAHMFAHAQGVSGGQQSSQPIDISNTSPGQGLLSTILPTVQSSQYLPQTPGPTPGYSQTLSTPDQPHTLPAQNSQSTPVDDLVTNTPTFIPAQTPLPGAANLPSTPSALDSHPVQINDLSAHTPAFTPEPISQSILANNSRILAHPEVAPRRKLSTRQMVLLIGLIALIVLGGSGTLLFRSITVPKNSLHGSASDQGSLQASGNLSSGQTPAGSGGIVVTPTPTTGHHLSTPTSRAISIPVTASTPGVTPTSQLLSATPTSQLATMPTATPLPTATPTSIPPPTATPQPAPPSCLTDTWTSHLRPTFSKGGYAHYVSSYCSGVVSLTLTQAPASGGNEVDFQICYALNTTNCSSWVPYTSPNAWSKVATGLSANQVFYINTRCNSCTSDVTLNGGVKY